MFPVTEHRKNKLKPLIERFEDKVFPDPNTGCFLWGGSYAGRYGVLKLGRKGEGQESAHRISYKLYKDKNIPDGMYICHKCDNPSCVNPDHLFLASPKDNSNDMVRKNRQYRPIGIKNKLAKLNEDKIRQIRLEFNSGSTITQLSNKYKVSRSTIKPIVSGRGWIHVR